jgi:hypothetical protein
MRNKRESSMNWTMPLLCVRSRIVIAAMLGALITVPALIAPAQAFATPTPPTASRCGADAANTAASPKFPGRNHYDDCECNCDDDRHNCKCNCSGDDDDDWW